ncbi:hypothetical protein C408_1820 [Vibrio diabolicus E0666]|uniref:hypothetical protein n=1 Tax=Vibrio diabolicus TaxID=50719 RepID=UPI0002B6EF1B|nr:hypothetical protein [Vibrio diabolicus]HCE2309904.1 hypothetical protein [Vibrio parahaemolyticus]EMD79690.1 hypothetical protein C408_1820 [Vibrio diabolicus E0666]HCE4677222.1 hypothetical protein [Vibrio parahaemolyticus]HCG5280356.1 hypothetical protein [Vibrio parahaemolyticus]HCG5955797.1 hypothetical protein [Vibrio parahaemolyticus]
MGFWDNVGKLAKAGAQAGAKMASDTYGDMKEAQADAARKSDDQLARTIANRSGATWSIGAARQELKSRGYSDDAIQSLVNRHR